MSQATIAESQGVEVAPWIAEILGRCRCDGKLLFLPPESLDRARYVAVDKVLRLAGGRWEKKRRAHVFDDWDAESAIDPILLSGRVRDHKAELGQFWTPFELAERVASLAPIKPDSRVLEPSAGQGALVRAALRAGATDVHYCEIDQRLKEKHLVPLAPRARGFGGTDFLKLQPADFPGELFDIVLMNPPFARQADIKHVAHAFYFLRGGGTLVAIMSAGTAFRENATAGAFRDFINGRGAEWWALPEGSFKESGTAVRAYLIRVVRP